VIVMVLPGVTERMLEGFGATNASGATVTNDEEVTAGRTLIWPYVIERIERSPLFGYGRMGMQRSGLTDELVSLVGEVWGHPHNAYLQVTLDNGLIGAFPVIGLHCAVLLISLRMFRGRSTPLASAAGGMSSALCLSLMIAGVGSQTFYPREASVGMWAAIGLTLRLYVNTCHVGVPVGLSSVAGRCAQ
jgi:O-antigen ligase